MIAKRISVLALGCLALFSSCEKDSDLQGEVDRLEKELIAEKGKTVVDIKKEGESLVVVYSNGTSQTLPFTEAIKGSIGTQSGTGIESITYNEQSGILTIKLTNGEVSEFKIFDNGTDWKAVLVGDTNGRLFIEEALLGAVPIIKATYNDSYQLTFLESYRAEQMQIRKAFDLSKNYANGVLNRYTHKTYALSDRTEEYIYEYVRENHVSSVTFSEFKNYSFLEANGDGTYSHYRHTNSRDNQHQYTKTSICILVPTSNPESDSYTAIRKVRDNQYYYYYYLDQTQSSRVYALERIVTMLPNINAGDILRTHTVDLETDAQGRVLKSYKGDATSAPATSYISYEYNSLGLVKSTRSFFRNDKGSWVADGRMETYHYNAENRLVSIVRTAADGSTQEVQKAVYDKNGNPLEIWAWEPAVYSYTWKLDPPTGEYRPVEKLLQEAGLRKIAMLEYDYAFKNFLGNTVQALVPELEGYKIVNALKRATRPNSYAFANMEYKDFDEYGYPRRMKMDASFTDVHDAFSANLEVVLKYKVRAK